MARAQEQFQPCEEDRLAFELHAPIAEAAWLERYLKSENGRSLGSEMIDSVLNRVVTASGAESLAIVRVAEAKWLEGRELALDDF